MEKIFGIPVTTLTVVLVAALAVSLAYVLWIAIRRPVLFKMGMRNIPRRKAQTTLIVVGLMLSTLIIAASLGTGDTLNYSMTSDVYRNLGTVDSIIVSSPTLDAPAMDTTATFDATQLALVEQALAGNANVDGSMPYLDTRFPVRDVTSNQAEPDIVAIGIDPSRLEAMGGLQTIDGASIDRSSFDANSAVLSEKAADDLNAKTGDTILVGPAGNQQELTVSGIAENTFLSGYRRGRENYQEYAGLAVSLEVLQNLTGKNGQLSGIALSHTGGIRGGQELTDDVRDALAAPLAGTGLGLDAIKEAAVEDGEGIAKMFTTIFLVLGLFSVMSGLLLIVLIFSMLAAERRTEMGISRAVGTRSNQLTKQFIAEGAGYALIAGLIGALLGAAASVGISHVMKWLFGQYVPIEPHVEPRSIVLAYSLGVVITFLTIVVSARRVSKLNVVAAIRDIPELGNGKRHLRSLFFGVALAIGGSLLAISGLDSDKASMFYIGASGAIFGVAMVARFIGVPARLVYSVTGAVVLALWLLPERYANRLWGDLDQGIEMFFLAGMVMVVAATMVIVQNLTLLLKGVSLVGGVFGSRLPAVRTAVAYPAAARGRTGMTIAMFSLIIFSVVLMGAMSENFSALNNGEHANAGWEVRADVNGETVISDFPAALEQAGVDTTDIEQTATLTSPNRESSAIRLAGAEEWKQSAAFGADDAFLQHSVLSFGERAAGYPTDEAILDALLNEEGVAVIDSWAIPSEGDLGNDPNAFSVDGLRAGDQGFEPVEVEMLGSDGQPHVVRIIGVIGDDISTLHGVFMAQRTLDGIADTTAKTSYFISIADPATADTMAKSIEAALIEQGVQSVSIEEELADIQKQDSGFLKLIEGFMGLGLIVGLAAVGVISFRSVVERRQQIGMLRAIGYRRGLISFSFGLETLFVVGIGIVAGTVLGLVMGYNLFTSEDVGADGAGAFLIPWQLIGILVAGTLSVAALTTWIPARQASRVAPAEALRYE